MEITNTVPEEAKNNIDNEIQTLGFPFTKDFFEFTFKKKIDKVEVKLGTNPGDNYMSIIYAVDIIFESEEEAQNYLIKCYPNHPGRQEFLDKLNVFQKELFIYSEYFPELHKLTAAAGSNHVRLSIPTFQGGNVAVDPSDQFKNTPWSKENFIIMKDLRKENFQMANRMHGIDFDHAIIVLKEMAKLHALGWAFKERNELDLLSSKFPQIIDEMYCNGVVEEYFKTIMHNINNNALKVAEESLGRNHSACIGFKRVLEINLFEFLKKFMKPHGITENVYEEMLRVKPEDDPNYNTEPWLTGTHADCHANNVLFRYDENRKPVAVVFVDFQIFREASPINDIAYFLYSSVRAPIRNAFKEELLRAYHDAFLFHCKNLNVNPYPGFTMKSLKRRFRRSELFGFIVALPLLNLVLKPPEQSIDLEKEHGKNASELFECIAEGVDKTTLFKDEVIASLLNLYEIGVI